MCGVHQHASRNSPSTTVEQYAPPPQQGVQPCLAGRGPFRSADKHFPYAAEFTFHHLIAMPIEVFAPIPVRDTSVDQGVLFGLGLRQPQLARDQAREQGVAEGGEGLGSFVIGGNALLNHRNDSGKH